MNGTEIKATSDGNEKKTRCTLINESIAWCECHFSDEVLYVPLLNFVFRQHTFSHNDIYLSIILAYNNINTRLLGD